MSLKVRVISASSLPDIETFGKIDPFVEVIFQGQKKITQVKKGISEPEWNEVIEYELGSGKSPSPSDSIELVVKDHEKIGRNRFLGKSSLKMTDVWGNPPSPNPRQFDLPLMDKSESPVGSYLKVEVACTVPAGQVMQQVAPGGPPVSAGDPTLSTAAAGAGPDAAGGGSMQVPQSEGYNYPGGMPGPMSAARRQLADKETKFQVRVKVVEGRQLNGGSGSSVNPVVQIKFLANVETTSVAKATLNPWFDEEFYFYASLRPAQLFQENLVFNVSNAKLFRSDAAIGTFQMDLGSVYDQPQHTYLQRWLLLSSPSDDRSTAGYLKVSVAVLGPGDEAPSFDIASKSAAESWNDDMETNVLYPSGIALTPASFAVSVFRAEDLPRMDSGAVQSLKRFFRLGDAKPKKEQVDPYIVASFAGKKARSKTIYGADNPAFNENLNLGFLFPSVSDHVKLIFMDWDRSTDDDIIATAFLSIPSISATGDETVDGYLPVFGPTYVNFYGTIRKFSAFPTAFDANQNAGLAEGCSYRGRALVALKTDIGEYPKMSISPIDSDEVLKVDKFMRRRRFVVHVSFLNASMISDYENPVEFEVSMGNFGNKFEDSVMPSPSTTQPTNPVFDGSGYYFLPWGECKPQVSVFCQWEDIAFRIKALNKLRHIGRRLKNGIKQLEDAVKAGKTTQDLAVQFLAVIDVFIVDCDSDMPEPETGIHAANPLDSLLKNRRKAELIRLKKQATELRNHATDIQEVIKELENYAAVIDSIAIEPQNSLPDIIIWMLCGDKRVAYRRVAAPDIYFAGDEDFSGEYCAKTMAFELKYPQGDDSNVKTEIPALLRVRMWFGLEGDEMDWYEKNPDTELAVFAETYENQMKVKSWGVKGLLRPAWSDASGLYSLPKELFEEPENWKFSGDWFINPEPSMGFDVDAGHRKFLEDVFENENRIPGGKWMKPLTAWTDVRGDPKSPKDDIQCQNGWIWFDDWEVDKNRAVDEDGWEYAVEPSLGGYGSVEKVYHVYRRRRWVRQRVVDPQAKPESRDPVLDEEGWEYAPVFSMRFHAHERKIDIVRRRRWHRKLVAVDPTERPPHFKVRDESGEEGFQALAIPRMYQTYQEEHTYQLRAYVYQARDLLAGDRTGFSDPYASVCFLNQSQMTEKISSTLSPTWDQTLIFDGISIVGSPTQLFHQPPVVVVEIFDSDDYGKPEFLGRAKVQPVVDLSPEAGKAPRLSWHTIARHEGEDGGELLAAFHLLLKDEQDLPFFPPQRGNLFIVPSGIRPVLQRTAVEVLCWGLRNMDTHDLMPVRSPSIEFEIGDKVVTSTVISNLVKSPNFPEPALLFDIMLPKEDLYMPPLNIRVRDHRSFGSKPVVGRAMIRSLEKYRVDPRNPNNNDSSVATPIVNGVDSALIQFDGPQVAGTDSTRSTAKLLISESTVITVEPTAEDLAKEKEADVAVDWWSKYYASVGEKKMSGKYLEKGYETLDYFRTELEEVPRYKAFQDFLSSIPLRKGKSKKVKTLGKVIGEFKGTFKVYPLPGDRNEPLPPKFLDVLPSSKVEEVVARIYVVRARDLVPADPTTRLADPYVTIVCGKKKFSSKKEYRPNTLQPVFGHMFEITAEIPTNKDLLVQVWDYDTIGSDDLIGETKVDLENRCLTKYRATCGLPRVYHVSGPNQWRDAQKPREILDRMAQMWHVGKPFWRGLTSVTVGSKTYSLPDFEMDKKLPPTVGPEDERLALYVLHSGLGLVGEHVETRSLYKSNLPGLEQGKLEMFVDIFPKSLGPPGPPVSIEPRKPTRYVLRVVVWNTQDVVLDETSVATGEAMSDIFVKGFLQGRIQDAQKTDIHYRSMDGEGLFNWRMVFAFDYLEAEQVIIHKESKAFWKDSREVKIPPRLVLQIWDDDFISRDDQLGEIILDLNNLIPPAKSQDKCSMDQLPTLTPPTDDDDVEISDSPGVKFLNLFQAKRISGFWPVTYKRDGETQLTGKLEMELEVLTEAEALERPAGLGRDEPNMNPKLEPPKRPDTSFFWLSSPWKSFKHIVWKHNKWAIITFFVIVFLVIFAVLFIYNFPEALVNRLV